MDEENRADDLSKLGCREVYQLAELLKAYAEHDVDFLNDGVTWGYNPNSDNLYLVDTDGNAGMMNNGKVEQWLTCSDCSKEGFKSDVDFHDDYQCTECFNFQKANN